MRPLLTLRVLPLCALVTTLASAVSAQLGIETTRVVDCSRKSRNGDRISVHYNGTLKSDGTQFDSSYGRGEPFKFLLGDGQVIQGWEEGLLDMCIGEARRLTIPPEKGYGSAGSGPIPGDSTLIFETELMGIDGVKPEPAPARPVDPIPARPSIVRPEDSSNPSEVPIESPPPSAAATAPTTSAAAASGTQKPTAEASPMENKDAECHLLGPYALFVQGALGLLAVTALIYKRWRESPRRPLKIWFFDVSKQVFGSAMLHLANVLMSMLSSGHFDVATNSTAIADAAAKEDKPNPCSWYLLNITIDTTIGIPILVVLLKLLHRAFSLTPLASPAESIRSGNYGQPPRVTWWLKQSLIYFLGLAGMKFCVFILFQLLPWIVWVGDWALRWTEGNEAIQITFVMFIFPLIMNALQYWIIDGFIKDPSGGEGNYMAAAREESFDEDSDDEVWLERHRQHRRGEDDEDSDVEAAEVQPLQEANPTAVPIRQDNGKAREYDPETDGTGVSK